MRRTEQEFKAEIFRRISAYKKRRKEKIRKTALTLGCVAALILAVPMLPIDIGWNTAEKLELVMDSVSMAPQAPEQMSEAPESEQKSENIYSTGSGTQILDVEPEEECPAEGAPLYEIQVTLVHADGTEEEWYIRGEDRIRSVTDALQAFRDTESSKTVPEGISEMEGISVYTIFFIDHNQFCSFNFYVDQDALWNNYDGGYWVGQDAKAARELLGALKKE